MYIILFKKVFVEKTQWNTWPLSNAYRREPFEFLYLPVLLPKLFDFFKTQNLDDVAYLYVSITSSSFASEFT